MMIRLMGIQDYDEVYALWMHNEGVLVRRMDDSREVLGKYLMRNPTSSFVAVEDSRIVGAILSGHDGRRGYVYHACVDIPFRGNGIGKQLVECVVEALRKEEIFKIALMAARKNDWAGEFWQRMGFRHREELEVYSMSLSEDNG